MVPAAKRWGAVAVLSAVTACFLGSQGASAQGFIDEVSPLLTAHKRVVAAEADLVAARERVKESYGQWYPRLDLNGHYGRERTRKPGNERDTDLKSREIDVTLTQRLWDFGAANASIDRAELQARQADAALSDARQSVLLDAISAYMEVTKAVRVLDYARGSEANIKRQTELEDARVARGSGFSTDVLQAKTQLAGAQALRVRAEGALRTALNRYRSVFGREPDDIRKMIPPRLPAERLPDDIDEAVKGAVEGNHSLRASRLSAEVARVDIVRTKAEKFFPTLNAVGEGKYKEDVQGTAGNKSEEIIKVEFTYSFNLGATAINTLRAAEQTHVATENRVGDSRDQVEQQARNQWDGFETAKANAEHLRNQANIASEFLELARKERSLGRRTLIDVLQGETAFINASSDAAAAETDVALAVYRLLAAMGKLDLSVFQ